MKKIFENKDIFNEILGEAVYSLSGLNRIEGKTFIQILEENKGVPFDTDEKRTFIENQEGFGGIGKIMFILNKKTYEISAQIYNNGNTKDYVFKKLENKVHSGMYNYACFIHISNPQGSPQQQSSDTTNQQQIDTSNIKESRDYYLSKLFEDDNNNTENNQQQQPVKPSEDVVYALSSIFDNKEIKEKLTILNDFISRINSIGF